MILLLPSFLSFLLLGSGHLELTPQGIRQGWSPLVCIMTYVHDLYGSPC